MGKVKISKQNEKMWVYLLTLAASLVLLIIAIVIGLMRTDLAEKQTYFTIGLFISIASFALVVVLTLIYYRNRPVEEIEDKE